MTLNPKLSVKSVASIKSFGALYKVDSNHDWLLPIDENNRRCKAAGYSGLKDYFIRKGLKLTKWKDTGLIKELVKPNGELMTFNREFSFFKVDGIRPDLKENKMLRACSYSMKKTDTVMSPKRIRSVSPTLKHAPVKRVELTAEETDNKIKISQTSINVYYKLRKSKTHSILKYDKENNAVTQERNQAPSNARNVFPLVPGKSLMCLPKVSFTKCSEGNLSGSVHSDSAVKQNALRESLTYRKFDRKSNSSAAKPSQKLEMRVTRKKCNNTNNRNSRDGSLSKPPNKRSETQYSSLNVNIRNKFVDIPPAGNLECNSDGSTTSTSLSMFSARSSIYSFSDKKESVIRIDITSSSTESRSKKSLENVETRLLYTHAGEGCYNKTENFNSFSKRANDQANEKQGENSKKTSNKSELKLVYLQTMKPAVEVPKYSEQTSNSKPKRVKTSSDEQLSSEGAKMSYEPTQNNSRRNNDEKDCFESVVLTKESCFKADEDCLTKEYESCKETDAEFGAVNIVYPTSAGIMQKLEISNATSEQLIPETTAVTLDYSNHDYMSLIDVRCTLKDVRCTLKGMRRSFEDCSETSQKEEVTDYGVSDIVVKDNDITARLTKFENFDADALNDSCSGCWEKQYGTNEFEGTNSNTIIIKVKDRKISYLDEKFRPVLLLDINHSRAVEKANSVHGVPMIKANFPEHLFLKFEGSKSYSSVVIRKLIENPLLTQEIYNSLSSAMTPNMCYHLQHSMDMNRMLLHKEHELYKTMEQRCPRSILQTEVSSKDARTQKQKYFDQTDNNECIIVCDVNLETQNMQAGVSYKGVLTETRTEDYEIDDEWGCKISGDDMREDNPETQNLQVDIYDKGEDSDDLSVYEDALELL